MNFENIKSFGFVTNPLDVKFSKTIEIIPEHYFRKAKDNEIKRIREVLTELLSKNFYGYPYEVDRLLEKVKDNTASYKHKKLIKNKWRYFVIEFRGSNQNLIDLERAANIAPVELRCNILFIGKTGKQYHPTELQEYLNNLKYIPAEGIDALDERGVKEIGDIYSTILNIQDKYPDIKRSIEMFYDLNYIPRRTNLMILGLFAVIESIITHQPKAEAGDSLSHQIRTKILLLAKRFDDEINYKNFFNISDENKIWTNLYDYRSRIAHGGKINLSGYLKILKNHISIVNFLRIASKLLLRKAISEPQLCMDLKKC